MSELSKRTDTTIATIKFYLREGLLPAGTPTARNQADYGDEHVARLRLIHTMTGVGTLSLAAVRDVLCVLDQEQDDDSTRRAEAMCEASQRAARLMDNLGWRVDRGGAEPAALGQLLHTLDELGGEHDLAVIEKYARAAAHVARYERELVAAPAPADTAEARRTLFHVVLAAVRRLAHESASAG